MQQQPLGSKSHELAQHKSGKIVQFQSLAETCKDICRAKDGAVFAQLLRYRGANPRIPRPKWRGRVSGVRSHATDLLATARDIEPGVSQREIEGARTLQQVSLAPKESRMDAAASFMLS